MKIRHLTVFLLLSLVANSLTSAPAYAAIGLKIATAGPGVRIHGMDISRWQHPDQKPIDFRQMHAAGIRFVMIKGADTHDVADATALKYLKIDRTAAQRAAIYTGFYYYATLPDSTDPQFIVTDAHAQAQKIIWRLSAIGGYNRKDLPLSLDLEENCVRINSGGTCTKFMNPKYVTLWAQTWLADIATKTNRKPMLYSYANFLENAMVRSPDLTQYPLWIAHYGVDPAVALPGMKSSGCYVHSWTNSDCSSQWQFWQYTSCGIGAKYGVPSTRVDLNVYSGTSANFYSLIQGIWKPAPGDAMPVDEPTTEQVVSVSSATTLSTAQIIVDVLRPDGSPVVTGTVNFKSLDSTITSGVQRVVRSASGHWSIFISKLAATHYLGLVNYLDASGTSASNTAPVEFDVSQGIKPSPTPIPSPTTTSTPTPNPKPSPVDLCAGQIIN